MANKKKLSNNERNLMRRYLVWCYKTTKEELDKVDRYFTQLNVDEFMLKSLRKAKDYRASKENDEYKNIVDEFEKYMNNKKFNVLNKKFKDDKHSQLTTDYQYSKNRFAAIEKAIKNFLGVKALNEITCLYEQEMTLRILQAREH